MYRLLFLLVSFSLWAQDFEAVDRENRAAVEVQRQNYTSLVQWLREMGVEHHEFFSAEQNFFDFFFVNDDVKRDVIGVRNNEAEGQAYYFGLTHGKMLYNGEDVLDISGHHFWGITYPSDGPREMNVRAPRILKRTGKYKLSIARANGLSQTLGIEEMERLSVTEQGPKVDRRSVVVVPLEQFRKKGQLFAQFEQKLLQMRTPVEPEESLEGVAERRMEELERMLVSELPLELQEEFASDMLALLDPYRNLDDLEKLRKLNEGQFETVKNRFRLLRNRWLFNRLSKEDSQGPYRDAPKQLIDSGLYSLDSGKKLLTAMYKNSLASHYRFPIVDFVVNLETYIKDLQASSNKYAVEATGINDEIKALYNQRLRLQKSYDESLGWSPLKKRRLENNSKAIEREQRRYLEAKEKQVAEFERVRKAQKLKTQLEKHVAALEWRKAHILVSEHPLGTKLGYEDPGFLELD